MAKSGSRRSDQTVMPNILIFPHPDRSCTVRFNDHSTREFADVISALESLRERSESLITILGFAGQPVVKIGAGVAGRSGGLALPSQAGSND